MECREHVDDREPVGVKRLIVVVVFVGLCLGTPLAQRWIERQEVERLQHENDRVARDTDDIAALGLDEWLDQQPGPRILNTDRLPQPPAVQRSPSHLGAAGR